MDILRTDTGHRFNLNVHPPGESRNEESNDPNHQKQSPHHDAASQQPRSNIEEGGNLVEMMSRIEGENMKIINSLADLFQKYEAMRNQLIDLMKIKSRPKTDCDEEEDDDHELTNHGKKRKASDLSFVNDINYRNGTASVHSCISEEVCCRRARLINYRPKISTAFVRTDQSDTSLAVKDGYQWRKYGQKVTRDNPSPRAYYKCSFAPLCSVKKKVQRSIDDTTVLMVTYEGEHNHKKPPSGATLSPSSTELLIEPGDAVEGGVFQPRLVEQMASTLTKDPSFTSALASAIYSIVLQQKSL